MVHSGGVLHAGRVWTGDGRTGESIWWSEGVIRGVGTRLQVEKAAPSPLPRYPLPGVLVTPGIVDGHTTIGRMWPARVSRSQKTPQPAACALMQK